MGDYHLGTSGWMLPPILLRTRASTLNDMEEDALVGTLLAFMLVSQVEREEPLDRGEDEKMEEEATVTSALLTGVLNTEGKETSTEGERGDIADTKESIMASLRDTPAYHTQFFVLTFRYSV
jgi:hypothetical protein